MFDHFATLWNKGLIHICYNCLNIFILDLTNAYMDENMKYEINNLKDKDK